MSKSNTKYTSQYIDNMSFDESLQMRVTELIGADGVLKNPATEEKQGVFNEYAPAGQDISGDPMYFAGLKADGSWYIKRMYLSGDYTTKYANGTTGFDWSSRASLTYADFNTLTW